MNAQGEPVNKSILVFAPDERHARQMAQRWAYERGWIGVKISLESATGAPLPPVRGAAQSRWWANISGHMRVNAHEARAWVGAEERKVGMRVRTRVPGENWAGGTRHIMPPLSVGGITRRVGRGPSLRVSFPALPGHTFVYSPSGLEDADHPIDPRAPTDTWPWM